MNEVTDENKKKASAAGWCAHRVGIHWKRCGLPDELRYVWQGAWALREAAGRAGVLP